MKRRGIDPNHSEKRAALRVIGPVVLLLGITLTVIGFGMVVLGDPFEHKLMVALPFVGMP